MMIIKTISILHIFRTFQTQFFQTIKKKKNHTSISNQVQKFIIPLSLLNNKIFFPSDSKGVIENQKKYKRIKTKSLLNR